tara:strand:- start:194570 stop:195004 length:435 start_codon:yes stop_codon:yes gene_type:complete
MEHFMEKTKSVSGTCVCGKVNVKASAMKTHLGACHCSTCRKWSAGPFLSVECGTDVTIESKEYLKVFDSSAWAERGFCGNCGTNLFYHLKEADMYSVSAELFNESELEFDHQVFIDEKPNYYSFSNKTKDMTGAEVFAAHAPKE